MSTGPSSGFWLLTSGFWILASDFYRIGPPRFVEQAVREIREEARRLLYNELKSGDQFRLVSLEETDAVLHALGIDLPEVLEVIEKVKKKF